MRVARSVSRWVTGAISATRTLCTSRDPRGPSSCWIPRCATRVYVEMVIMVEVSSLVANFPEPPNMCRLILRTRYSCTVYLDSLCYCSVVLNSWTRQRYCPKTRLLHLNLLQHHARDAGTKVTPALLTRTATHLLTLDHHHPRIQTATPAALTAALPQVALYCSTWQPPFRALT